MAVFISHSSEDRRWHDTVARLLDVAGIKRWNPAEMIPGLRLDQQLKQGIDVCDACLFVGTAHSIRSQWCLAELGAFWGAGKEVVPWLADTSINIRKLPPQFQHLVWADDPKKAVAALRDAVSRSATAGELIPVEATRQDMAALPAVTAILNNPHVLPRHARLIQFSGDKIRPVIELLLKRGARVDLLLAHPMQLLRNPHVDFRIFQMGKMATFHRTVDADFSREEKDRLCIRYYLEPASLRGLAVDDALCCLGWYTHRGDSDQGDSDEGYWLRGHDNASIIGRSPRPGHDPLRDMFDRAWSRMWEAAVPRSEDDRNITNLLRYQGGSSERVVIEGVVVSGHGVASGASSPGGVGTLHQQKDALGRFIDWAEFWPGTINVCIAPRVCAWRRKTPTIRNLKWSAEQPAEDFGLSRCRIDVMGLNRPAWVYFPLPGTKTQHIHEASIVEIVAPRIEGLRKGQVVSLTLNGVDLAID